MKSLRITLGVAAIAIGSFAAFAFAPVQNKSLDDPARYYTNPDGSPTSTLENLSNPCEDDSDINCSALFQVENGTPVPGTGTAYKNGPRP